ncbi:cytochrome bd-I oxidase subunit CydX [Bradyrhizobium sp. Arg816]|nr:cytochrome bd-I oxidase subunit CydX [Bradyrhizobium sp. Arg816]MDI3560632.1 cytochrome bd-I oxidase subunit CydX [Bradyrhizobium sp. Arg816]
MWYFAWILGIGFACSCGILNAVWHEHHLPDEGVDSDI